ncbi:hypothetical protein [Paenibacillus silvae]|uniref:Uncharacterized protein n=1 Tax=Paenibacillus silvae TaxID=1325358 RepID=A0A2W6PGV8_9BACL|nr:hypothetical protein [Paenibacillus silvae]PZT57406.1 hypothetical protein DN757_01750 [Paenibacillus silvae]
MNKENSIKFSKVSSYLVFDVFGDGWDETAHVKVSCGEDIESSFKCYEQKQWEELFDDQYSWHSVESVEFKGFEIRCEDDEGNRFRAGNDLGEYGSATFNTNSLEAKNAQKLERIRQILNT